MTDEPVEGAGVTWREVREHAGATGLLPVLLDARRDSSGARRPWDSGELDPSRLHLIDWVDPADALRAGWAGDEELDAPGERGWLAGLVEPWGPQFPGLALAEAGRLDGVTVRAALAAVPPAWIGLVHAARPADVVTALGWPGASSAGTVLGAPARLSAVLRSWEDRFGAHLFRLGFDTVQLLVERPPSTEASALAVAAEHLAFAGPRSFRAYAPEQAITTVRDLAGHLRGAPVWRFWWDQTG